MSDISIRGGGGHYEAQRTGTQYSSKNGVTVSNVNNIRNFVIVLSVAIQSAIMLSVVMLIFVLPLVELLGTKVRIVCFYYLLFSKVRLR
jgi:hypothetical protein